MRHERGRQDIIRAELEGAAHRDTNYYSSAPMKQPTPHTRLFVDGVQCVPHSRIFVFHKGGEVLRLRLKATLHLTQTCNTRPYGSHCTGNQELKEMPHVPTTTLPWITYVFSICHGQNVCAKRTGAATSVACRRRERLALAGGGMQACRSGTRAASQAFERTQTHMSLLRKHRMLKVQPW